MSLLDSSISSGVTVPPTSVNQQKPPVWPMNGSVPGVPILPAAGCVTPEDGVCCKDAVDNERTLVNPDVVRDVVIGLSDGLTVPFALAAGLSSLGESNIVVLGGFAELIAGAISMGVGGFLASQSERDHYRYLRQRTAQRVARSCAWKMEREVSAVLAPVGVDEDTCRAVARCLREVEVDSQGNGTLPTSGGTDLENMGLKWSQDLGLTAFLLKFGQGLQEIPHRRMYVSAFTIGTGYFVGGLFPLLPYLFVPRAQVALIYSCIVTGIVLLMFGAIKARVTGASQSPAGYIWNAFTTLMVGGVAAGAAFGIVKLLEGLE